MVRNDFVSNSSSSSFIVAYKNNEARKKFAEFCKNSGYGKISDIMYKCVNIKLRLKDINNNVLCFDEEVWDDIVDEIKNNNDITNINSNNFGVYTEDSSEINDNTFADMKIYDLIKEYNNKDVKIVWQQGGW